MYRETGFALWVFIRYGGPCIEEVGTYRSW